MFFLSYSIEYETGMCFALLDSNMWKSCVVWITHVFLSVGFYYMPCRWVLSRMDCRVWDTHVFRYLWFYYPTIMCSINNTCVSLCEIIFCDNQECVLFSHIDCRVWDTHVFLSVRFYYVTIICSMNQTCVSFCVIIMCIACGFFSLGLWSMSYTCCLFMVYISDRHELYFVTETVEYATYMCFFLWDFNTWQACFFSHLHFGLWYTRVFVSVEL